jgi:hypothetical protein
MRTIDTAWKIHRFTGGPVLLPRWAQWRLTAVGDKVRTASGSELLVAQDAAPPPLERM